MDESFFRDETLERWEPPRRKLGQVQPLSPRPAGLRLDVGWLIAIRTSVAALLLSSVLWPDRPLLLLSVSFLAAACVLSSAAVFRLPYRLRAASRIEAITVGVIAPVAVIQAYVAHPGAILTRGGMSLVLETTVALLFAQVGQAIAIERRREVWSATARTLVLWPGCILPAAVLASARAATSPALAFSLGGCFLAASLVTLAARVAPVRAASWVVFAGTIGYFVLILSSGALDILADRPPVALLAWIIQMVAGLSFLLSPVRERILRALQTVSEARLGFGTVRRERLAEKADRDRGDFVPLL
ncbi:hypothetical protein OO015_01815 [Thermomicrobium sp. 4228-Ro]|uniref:hypothetical protein n=1 Tax=Thermomicrobium sp. 4228-Ro TaxID=2993937 RepID=UPI002248B098|nr:hypothetical protein [Thermomicrobium sp. 4228-Ro]MCX2726232.1 hypothetical protein [Thermomicrobium sp. 4228-Ro]